MCSLMLQETPNLTTPIRYVKHGDNGFIKCTELLLLVLSNSYCSIAMDMLSQEVVM